MFRKKPIEWDIDSNGCWIVKSHWINRDGYPMYRFDGKMNSMSRYIWQELFGEIPEKIEICHKCDVPRCINPEHLFLGTHEENIRDMKEKGRADKTKKNKGQFVPMAKLTNEQAYRIFTDNRSAKEIATEYRISVSSVRMIKRGNTWRSVTGKTPVKSNQKSPIRLKQEQIFLILQDSRRHKTIAAEYGVSRSTISTLKRRKARLENVI